MRRIIGIGLVCLSFISCQKDNNKPYTAVEVSYGTMTDERDGTTYKTITIGEQEWMVENLRYRFPKGTLEGCYTYGEAKVNEVNLVVDQKLFADSMHLAIANKEIVDPPNLPETQRPTYIIKTFINFFTPRQLMDRLTPYPDVVAVIRRIEANLKIPASIKFAAESLTKIELENGHYMEKYGLLYTYETALKAAPEGWRLATDADWTALEKQLGIAVADLDKMEAWRGQISERLLANSPEGVGFDAQLGGGRLYGSFPYGTPFMNKEVNGYYWSSSTYQANDSTSYPITRNFMRDQVGIWRGTAKEEAAYHVKCIKIK